MSTPHWWAILLRRRAEARELEQHAFEMGHTHRQPRAVLLWLIAGMAGVLVLMGIIAGYLVATADRGGVTEQRLEVNEDRDAADRAATRAMFCDALAGFPSDTGGPLDQLRSRLRCDPTPPIEDTTP